ncbi:MULTISPECIES: hypothetical protein [unclassified Caballeronia]|uniref:hypothetical protein n=1 Tax=unclassified Caballeronia TaxID=2646786 RepID=UPI002029A4A0|nr:MULTISPECIES: hypothetical protein [unclassified Caballeronia]
MNDDRRPARLRAPLVGLVGVAALSFATAATADSQALKKFGQITVINQTLQPKPVKSAPAAAPAPPANNNPNASNTATPNPNISPNRGAAPSYDWNKINAANAANAAAAARVNAIPGAPPVKK